MVAPGVHINPRIHFGRPCMTGTGLSTATIASRFRAGDSVTLIARGFRLRPSQVEAAIRYEMRDSRQRKKDREGVEAAVKAVWKDFKR
jgi:uncharacterized protein (DUF433 family)